MASSEDAPCAPREQLRVYGPFRDHLRQTEGRPANRLDASTRASHGPASKDPAARTTGGLSHPSTTWRFVMRAARSCATTERRPPSSTGGRGMRTLALLSLGALALTTPAATRAAVQTPSRRQIPAALKATQVAIADPIADPAATVVEGHARFTLLTSRLVRMEWSADGHFENRASLVFIHRRLAVPHYTLRRTGGWLTVQTDNLTLRYLRGSGRFRPGNLEVRLHVDGRDVVWNPSESDSANLKGTTRTLDGAKGPVPLEPGLPSRAGWIVVDDSQRPLFDRSGWVLARPEG